MEIINNYTQNKFNNHYQNDGTTRSSYFETRQAYYYNNRETILIRCSEYEKIDISHEEKN